MSWELYIRRDDWMRRLHPLTRMVTAFALFVCAVVLVRLEEMLALCALVVLLGILTGCAAAFRRFLPVLLLVGLLCFLMWLSVDWARLRGAEHERILIGAPKAAVAHAAAVTLRLLSMLLAGIVLFATTSPEDFLLGLRAVGLPFAFAFSVTLAVRLFPLFLQKAFTIMEAQRARGLRVAGNPIRRTIAFVPLIAPVFMSSLAHIQRLSLAVEARGFRPGAKRTLWRPHKFSLNDLLVFIACAALLSGALLVRILT